MVFIRTPFSGWIVHIQNDRVTKLRHENYRQRRDEALKIHKKCFEGYHKQKLPSSRFYDVVSYIKYHDEGMLKRLGDKRSRIDIILDRKYGIDKGVGNEKAKMRWGNIWQIRN